MGIEKVVTFAEGTTDRQKERLQRKYQALREVTLEALIAFAKRLDSPEMYLSTEAQAALKKLVMGRAKEGGERVEQVLRRSLSVFPHYLWASEVVFYGDGRVDTIRPDKYRLRGDIIRG